MFFQKKNEEWQEHCLSVEEKILHKVFCQLCFKITSYFYIWFHSHQDGVAIFLLICHIAIIDWFID
jgi:hypothetical protein